MDVAQALANLMEMPRIERTLNLPGPSTLTYEFLLDLVASVSLRPASSAPALPKGLAKWAANLVSKFVWWPTLSPDEIERRYIDDATVPGDWDVVGVTPSEIENHAITYLRRYRSAYVLCSFISEGLKLISLTATTSFARLRSRRVLRRCRCNSQTCYLRLGGKNDKDLRCIWKG